MSTMSDRMHGMRVLAQAGAVIGMLIIPVGVGVSLEARSIENAAALVEQSARGVPETAELFVVGMALVGVAASTRRVMRRRQLRDHATQCPLEPVTSLAR
jgi:hypothetical protein